MTNEGELIQFVERQPMMMEVLRQVASLGLTDAWVGAGFIRNSVWDALHDRAWRASYTDIDIVYFDADNTDENFDRFYEIKLKTISPNPRWSVKNQAIMYLKNGDRPYSNTENALCYWPEICTAVALRWYEGRIELLAPFGIDDLISLRVRPTPAFADRKTLYRRRIAEKQWAEHWPRLIIED